MSEIISDVENLPTIGLREIYQTVFMIHKILIVHHDTSLPVFEKDVENSMPFNAAMVTGVLQALSTIGQEMIGRPTGFKKLVFHGFVVSGAHFNGYTIYVFSETELDKEMEKGMQKLIIWFSKIFRSVKDDWDGSMDIFNINKAIIENKFAYNLYLWLLYPFKSSKNQQLDVDYLSMFGRTIFDCVNKNMGCTCARLMDYFKQYDEEEVLYEIFNLVSKGFIVTSTDD